MSSTLAETLALRASEAPAQPWLFFPVGWQWRWISWQEGLIAYEEVRTALRQAFPEPADDCSLAMDPVATPGNLLLWIATEELRLGLGIGTGEAPTASPDSRIELEYRTRRPPHDRIAIRALRTDGAGEARPCSRAVSLRESPSGRRDIVFVSGSLRTEAASSLVRWGLESGAAVALEHDAAARLQALLWLRPTVALVDPDLARELSAAVGLGQSQPTRRQRRARRQSRLRALVGPDLRARARPWQDLGIDVLELG